MLNREEVHWVQLPENGYLPRAGTEEKAMVFEESRRDEMVAEIRRFTARQLEVTKLLAEGYSYKEIAATLGISPHTVNTHVKTILRRLRLSGSRRLAALVNSMREAESACNVMMESATDDRMLPA